MSGFYVMEPRPYTVPKDLIKFVNTYAPSYFLGNPQIVPSARQSSPWAEEEIDKVLESKQGLRHRKDVIRVLAWKMGGLNHKSSTEEYPFIFKTYRKNNLMWCDSYPERAVNNGNNVDNIHRLVSFIVDENNRYRWNSLEAGGCEKAKTILQDLSKCVEGDKDEEKVSQIGPVYLITLLFFITSGEYPIYDIQAMKALKAIEMRKVPGEQIEIDGLPSDIKQQKFWDLYYREYIGLLRKYFHDEYKTNRNIDRALWVYGHYFKAISPRSGNK